MCSSVHSHVWLVLSGMYILCKQLCFCVRYKRKNRERQEKEEVTDEPKRFTMQEAARRFSLFEEVLLVFET